MVMNRFRVSELYSYLELSQAFGNNQILMWSKFITNMKHYVDSIKRCSDPME
jgi:hypothetical protein